MPNRAFELAVRRQERAAANRVAEDLRRLITDAGLSIRSLAAAAGLDHGHVARIVRGEVTPSVRTYARLAVPLGADLVTRLYPNTGPLIRDRHQARILEFAVQARNPRWQPFTEVAVRSPARGFIDTAFHEARDRIIVATEIQSDLRRLEQLVRWAQEKAASLPSWEGWARLGDPPAISRLLLVRQTRATRTVAREFAEQLRVAYPAHPDDAIGALTGTQPWPGAALVWVRIESGTVGFVSGR